jgi:hypothetical protein
VPEPHEQPIEQRRGAARALGHPLDGHQHQHRGQHGERAHRERGHAHDGEEAQVEDGGNAAHHERAEAHDGGERRDQERRGHPLDRLAHDLARVAAELGLLVVVGGHVDHVGAADHQQQRRHHERAERDRLAEQHQNAEGPDQRDADGHRGQDDAAFGARREPEGECHEKERQRCQPQQVAAHHGSRFVLHVCRSGVEELLRALGVGEHAADAALDVEVPVLRVRERTEKHGDCRALAVRRQQVLRIERPLLQRRMQRGDVSRRRRHARQQRRRRDDVGCDVDRVRQAQNRFDAVDLGERVGDVRDLLERRRREHVVGAHSDDGDVVAAELRARLLVEGDGRIALRQDAGERALETRLACIRTEHHGDARRDHEHDARMRNEPPCPAVHSRFPIPKRERTLETLHGEAGRRAATVTWKLRS